MELYIWFHALHNSHNLRHRHQAAVGYMRHENTRAAACCTWWRERQSMRNPKISRHVHWGAVTAVVRLAHGLHSRSRLLQ